MICRPFELPVLRYNRQEIAKIGTIAGDIIGSVYELNNCKRTDFPLFDPLCRFTDDTVLTAAVAVDSSYGPPAPGDDVPRDNRARRFDKSTWRFYYLKKRRREVACEKPR
jgi:ADP-ribosylglycohydrolase